MSLHKEINLEEELCEHLAAHGWLYVAGDAAHYDRARALYPADVIAWVQETQPKAWDALKATYGDHATEKLLARLREQLDQQGTLDVLRFGIGIHPVRQQLRLAEFKPALGLNAEILARYAANRLRVVRQVRYSLANENCFDLVLFLNGIPVATAELKTDFTQSVQDAIDQYRFDRHPRPKGQAVEPLLAFASGALVHFAISNSEVHMTTRLDGPGTTFLPFNRGDNGAKGNPPNANGHRTAYLWEEVWARDSWLEILGRYIIAPRNEKKQITSVIFPRFHQLDVTRKLEAAVRRDGAGGRYLAQHSAGSGKTNSIAWTAHFLAELHDAEDRKVFDSVLVVSDRNVIDAQLQDALFSFQRQSGVVATITREDGSKSAKLAEALSGNKKIVVCTIQTFPFALEAVRELAATKGKRFAVIADEAHGSQAGEAAAKLKAVLSPEELAELEEGGEVGTDDILAAQMAARAKDSGITYIAFTATPKAKTMELFGQRPDPSRPAGPGNLPEPFHVYSMRQAIEEGFILDVLQNYTPYHLAFRLAHNGKDYDETTVERAAAMKGIMGWVRLHPYNIAQKVAVVVEHYRQHVAPLLEGKAKAMVVVGSRVEAVRWKLAIDRYIAKHGYPLGTLVAFSGEVTDPESGPDRFSENSRELNPRLKGRDIRRAFAGDEYQILLVANKFQTGFDQPLLCGMYVDKRLAGIQAVQTLSRLNRAYPGKRTYVVDFVNEPEEVLAAFRTYYETATLAATTDPNIVHDLHTKLDGAGYYSDEEVDRVVEVVLDPLSKQGTLDAAISPVAVRLLAQYNAARDAWLAARGTGDGAAAETAQSLMNALVLFKGDMGAYVRLYTFLAQIFDYGNTALEKRAIFYRLLIPLLEFGREREGIDLSRLRLTHHQLRNQGPQILPLAGDKPYLAPPEGAGSGLVRERQRAYLSEIVERVNSLFEGDLTEEDKLVYVNNVILGKLLESRTLQQQAANNTKEQFGSSPTLTGGITDAIMDAMEAHAAMSRQALNSQEIREGIKDILLNYAGLWEALRARASESPADV
ncbi:MAG TPA: type I restriction endonuclease [Vicinamibacterales bacterium]|nr:type I restriction endonuclease [Vicinamibacterales bacterium]